MAKVSLVMRNLIPGSLKRYQHQSKTISTKGNHSGHPFYNSGVIKKFNSIAIPDRYHQIRALFSQSRNISSDASSKSYSKAFKESKLYTFSELDVQEYHQISDETLHQLTESLEALIESGHPKVEGWDLDFSSGVLTFSMGESGTYVVNKQPPSKQIWFSSPISGPKRFDYDREMKTWFYARDNGRMMDLIRDEISDALGDDHFVKILDDHLKDEQS